MQKQIMLKKIYREVWKRKRGAATEEFTGHEVDHFVNGVPVKKKEYDAAVAKICPEHLFSLLTNPTAFSALHWQKQRSILIEVCGDVSDADIIASNHEFVRLPEILNGKKVDDWKKVAAGRRTEINKRLTEIPARIDELKKSKPELVVTNAQTMISTLTKLRGKLEEKNAEIATIHAGGGVVELQKRLYAQESIISGIRKNVDGEQMAAAKKNTEAIADAQFRLGNVANLLADAERKISLAQEDIGHVTEANISLSNQWKEVSARSFVPGPCPTCGQDIPSEQVEQARASFNITRSNELQAISDKGFANRARIAALKESADNLIQLRDRLAADKVAVEGELLSALRDNRNQIASAEDSVEYQASVRERDALLDEIQKAQAGKVGFVAEKQAERESIQSEISAAEKNLAAIEQAMDIADRVAELASEEKTLANEYAKIDGELFLVEQFTRAKVALLDERVNQKFKVVRFRMFEEQINGGITDTCKMTVDGVPYADLNSAARIQGGLDIIRTLSAHYGISLPIIIDNRESVCRIPDMNGAQVISLFVSEADKALRVEVAA